VSAEGGKLTWGEVEAKLEELREAGGPPPPPGGVGVGGG
jgi:hypothetical protein